MGCYAALRETQMLFKLRGEENVKYEKNEVINLIQDTVFKVTQIRVTSTEINLLDTSLDIRPSDFIYIFNLLEQELKVSVTDLLINHSYRVMEINSLSKALLELIKTNESCTIQT